MVRTPSLFDAGIASSPTMSAVIKFYMETQEWTEAEVREGIIDVLKKDDVSNYSGWDQFSIMQ